MAAWATAGSFRGAWHIEVYGMFRGPATAQVGILIVLHRYKTISSGKNPILDSVDAGYSIGKVAVARRSRLEGIYRIPLSTCIKFFRFFKTTPCGHNMTCMCLMARRAGFQLNAHWHWIKSIRSHISQHTALLTLDDSQRSKF